MNLFLHDVQVDIHSYNVLFLADGERCAIKCEISVKIGRKPIRTEVIIESQDNDQISKFASVLKDHLLDTIKKGHNSAYPAEEEP